MSNIYNELHLAKSRSMDLDGFKKFYINENRSHDSSIGVHVVTSNVTPEIRRLIQSNGVSINWIKPQYQVQIKLHVSPNCDYTMF